MKSKKEFLGTLILIVIYICLQMGGFYYFSDRYDNRSLENIQKLRTRLYEAQMPSEQADGIAQAFSDEQSNKSSYFILIWMIVISSNIPLMFLIARLVILEYQGKKSEQ